MQKNKGNVANIMQVDLFGNPADYKPVIRVPIIKSVDLGKGTMVIDFDKSSVQSCTDLTQDVIAVMLATLLLRASGGDTDTARRHISMAYGILSSEAEAINSVI